MWLSWGADAELNTAHLMVLLVDILLILNMVEASDAFKSGETWMPLCLPKFNGSGFLHTHASDVLCLNAATTEQPVLDQQMKLRLIVLPLLHRCHTWTARTVLACCS